MATTKRPTKSSSQAARPAARAGQEPSRTSSAFEEALHQMRRQEPGTFENVSGKWLVKALVGTLGGIAVLVWLAYCWLFWQGSWQLLYHPTEAVKRTPASVGLAYEPVRFGPGAAGTPLRTGWWIPAEGAQWTVLYLHGADGNLGDTVDAVAALHRAGVAVFAIDYRGYGQSAKTRPTEAVWVEDAGAAVDYLTGTRHLSPGTIVVYGQALGGNLAVELAAKRASLAGVVEDDAAENGSAVIFADARSHVVPARWVVSDRWDLGAAARTLRVPSLWLVHQGGREPGAVSGLTAPHTVVWLAPPVYEDPHFAEELGRWLGDLGTR